MASAELRDTRRRIKSVQATMKITRAMELIAASRIPKAQARVSASKPYTAKLIEVIRNVGGASGGASHLLLEQREVKSVGVLLISADRGLAGAYASSIIRMAEAVMIQHRKEGREVRLFVVGKKAQGYFDYRGYHIEQAFTGVTDTPGYGDARAVANVVMDAYADGRVDAVEAFYTRFDSALIQTPLSFELLPVEPPTSDDAAEVTASVATVDYTYEPSPEEILERLLPRYVEAIVFNMLLESSASGTRRAGGR